MQGPLARVGQQQMSQADTSDTKHSCLQSIQEHLTTRAVSNIEGLQVAKDFMTNVEATQDTE